MGVGARQRLCRVSRLSNWKRKKSLQARKSIHLSSGGFYCNKGENGASLKYLGGSVIIEHLDKQVGIARAASKRGQVHRRNSRAWSPHWAARLGISPRPSPLTLQPAGPSAFFSFSFFLFLDDTFLSLPCGLFCRPQI